MYSGHLGLSTRFVTLVSQAGEPKKPTRNAAFVLPRSAVEGRIKAEERAEKSVAIEHEDNLRLLRNIRLPIRRADRSKKRVRRTARHEKPPGVSERCVGDAKTVEEDSNSQNNDANIMVAVNVVVRLFLDAAPKPIHLHLHCMVY